MASLAPVAVASIDGTDNDGTDLGGTSYMAPTATGLSLFVATGTDQAAAQGVLARLNTPISTAIGAAEIVPQGTYGSPIILELEHDLGNSFLQLAAPDPQQPADPMADQIL